MVYCVGLTGGIASGKSTVARLFSELGVQVISADEISKELTAKDRPAYNKIVAHYGIQILLANGEINRTALKKIIFSDPQEKLWLEELLHPLIRAEIKQQVDSCTSAYCIIEIPLLVNKKNYPYINRILLIHTPIEIQIARVMSRDHCDPEQALAIVTAQPTLESRLKNTDDLLTNDGELNEIKQAVKKLHQQYMHYIKKNNTTN